MFEHFLVVKRLETAYRKYRARVREREFNISLSFLGSISIFKPITSIDLYI